MVELKNKFLEVSINLIGAELSKLKSNKEYLWEKSELYNNQSKILFPIIGTMNDSHYLYKGQKYSMNPHGFISEKKFCVEEKNESYVILSTTYDNDTLSIYPFKYKLLMKYELVDNELHIKSTILNVGESEMFFTLGFHPAFTYEALTNDYNIILDYENSYEVYFNPTNIYKFKKNNTKKITSKVLSEELSDKKTICYTNINSVTVENEFINMKLSGEFESLALWQKNPENPKFICIEPWFGTPDYADDTIDIQKKRNMKSIKSNGKYETSWKISL